MKSVTDLLHRTPWWALLLGGGATLVALAVFVTPYHIIQYRDDGRTVEESRAIKREIDNTFAENAINVGRNVVKGMIARTTDPARRAELEQALVGLEEARQELREAGREVLRAKREALESARQATRDIRDAVSEAKRQAENAPKADPESVAELRALERSLIAAQKTEREAERALRRAERAAKIHIGAGARKGDKPAIQIEIDPPAPPEAPGKPEAPAAPGQADAAASPPAAPLPPALSPDVASKIRRDVTRDMVRIGIGAALMLVLIPLFIVAVVVKFFADRSRASQRVAEAKRREAEYHRMGQQVTEAKLSALQAQVEPHFLYNTLASVQALTEVDPAKAHEMTGHLIQYLRNALPKMRESVSTVGQEVELARAYLNILQMRMGKRLAFEIDVPAELMEAPFPPLMLPSLVENSIKHGLEPQREGGMVRIGAAMQAGKLRMVVTDTGRGFPDEPGTGVGLANIRERLAALYGSAARLTLEANTPHGVVATIEVPAEGTRSGAAAATAASAAPESRKAVDPAPPPPASAPQPATRVTFWSKTWSVLVSLERIWRAALYYLWVGLVIVAGLAIVGAVIGVGAGAIPVSFGDELFVGPAGVLMALAAGIVGFVAATAALGLVMLVLYAVGYFIFGVAVFVVFVVLIALSPVLAPFILLGLLIWWLARRSKARQAPPPRVEPTLAEPGR
jgi:histidine kinase/histidine kinase/DNA gyrase B/HSP90-like ATPase